ncbi:Esterase FE4 [Cryptotermes secundus]|uniref:Carboxylic ester hydrolase n=2 Tax=Cryptotermes secundus TaxID=105785 RepID=A0A2J7RQ29_9NEOP|nr:Esterase FE4 [Cryptotermes secundus]
MMANYLAALGPLITVLQLLAAESQKEDIIVTVRQGRLKGLRFESVRGQELLAFLGIPYARPPVAELRFKGPQPPEPWRDTREAIVEGNVCPQRDMMSGAFMGDENCLFLNVFTNKIPECPEQLKAVMVWIHGGSYKGGSGTSMVYGPDHILTEDVVLVTINYRLGLLGFLSLCEVGVPGNNGLKDQVMALRWVQNNIAQFGGDPNRVTIFGESSGGASVHYHLLSPMSKGLFHRAIAQSGSALDPWAYAEPDFLRWKAFTVGERMNCSAAGPHELLRCLQEAGANTIVQSTVGQVFSTSETIVPLRPTREDESQSDEEVFLSGKPEDLIASGKFHNVPYITGVNSREAIIYAEDMQSIPSFWEDSKQHMKSVIADLLGMQNTSQANEIAEMALSYYAGDEILTNKTLTGKHIDLFSDLGFVLGADRALKMQTLLSAAPVYSYLFSFDGGLGLAKLAFHTQLEGVSHADELGYLFHTAISPSVAEESDEMKVLLKMVKMWTNFAKTGDPTPDCDSLLGVKWDPTTKAEHVYLSIDKEVQMRRDLFKERMQFWEDMLGPYIKPYNSTNFCCNKTCSYYVPKDFS